MFEIQIDGRNTMYSGTQLFSTMHPAYTALLI